MSNSSMSSGRTAHSPGKARLPSPGDDHISALLHLMPALGLNHLGFGFVLCVGGASTTVIRPHVECFASLGPTVMCV